jgi:hypothetical protein
MECVVVCKQVRVRMSEVTQQFRRGERRREFGCKANTCSRASAWRSVIWARLRQEMAENEGDGDIGSEGEEWSALDEKEGEGIRRIEM